jgi:uncharacterized protein (DUF1800 family)
MEPWAEYQPDAQRPWTPALAAHLLRRTTFGFSRERLDRAISAGPRKSIDELLSTPAALPAFNQQLASLAAPLRVSEEAGSQECAQLWLYRIMNTPAPFEEKATLFWHGYFAIAGKSALLEPHLQLLRTNALGRFDTLLLALSRDPATLLGCGGPSGFASALFGRYTGGSGVPPDAAQAFTGYGVLRNQFHYQPEDHQGSLTGDEAVRAALAQPTAARYVVGRLYRWLIAETGPLPEPVLAPLANSFSKDFDIGRAISTILRSNLFFSSAAIRQRVKSPLEFALNLTAVFQVSFPPASLYASLATLGQRLADPPTRDGWAGGEHWLNAFTLVGRANLSATLLAKVARYPDRREMLELLIQNDAPRPVLDALAKSDGAALALALAALPEFQLA